MSFNNIKNAINSCYLDTVLINLFHPSGKLSSILDKSGNSDEDNEVGSLILTRFREFLRFEDINEEAMSTLRELLTFHGWSKNDEMYLQQDISEFYLFIAHHLKLPTADFTINYFVDKGEKKSEEVEKLPYIPLSLPENKEKDTVIDIFSQWLHNNKVDSDDTSAFKSYELTNIPEFMILTFNRFTKENQRNDMQIGISNIIYPMKEESGTLRYEFTGCICHKGNNLHHGHYYSLVVLFNEAKGEDELYLFDDLKEPSFKKLDTTNEELMEEIQKEVVMAFYKRNIGV